MDGLGAAIRPVLGDKYPRAIGVPDAECWAEVWDELEPPARQVPAETGTLLVARFVAGLPDA
ncbi:hypothetical protein ACQPYE_18650 [Actinosynnema sp. CA-299493]